MRYVRPLVANKAAPPAIIDPPPPPVETLNFLIAWFIKIGFGT